MLLHAWRAPSTPPPVLTTENGGAMATAPGATASASESFDEQGLQNVS